MHGENGEEKVPVGSIKSNFGHLLPCAGGAGLIKVLLCLKNNKLVPSLHVDEVNPLLEKKEFPLRIITEVQDWKRPENGCRYAGISSFGIGGTNAHVIIKDAPADNREASGQKYYLVAASAKDEYALYLRRYFFPRLSQTPDDICNGFFPSAKCNSNPPV